MKDGFSAYYSINMMPVLVLVYPCPGARFMTTLMVLSLRRDEIAVLG